MTLVTPNLVLFGALSPQKKSLKIMFPKLFGFFLKTYKRDYILIVTIFNNPFNFLPWPLPERQAMVLWPPIRDVRDHLTEQTRTNMSAQVCK